MIRVGMVATVLSLLFAATAVAQDAASTERGAKVFTEQKCTICHSIAGEGNTKGSLDGVGARLTADDIRLWITDAVAMAAKVKAERKPAMKAFTKIEASDLDDLVAYLHALKEK